MNENEILNQIFKRYFDVNGRINLVSSCCWHIKGKGKNYILLRNCAQGHELKMFFDLEDLDEFLAFNFLSKQKIGYSIGGTLDFNVDRLDVFPDKKDFFEGKELKEKIIILSTVLKKLGMKKVYGSDVSNLLGEDVMKVIREIGNMTPLKLPALKDRVSYPAGHKRRGEQYG